METSVRSAPRLEDPAHEASLDASIRELENAVKEQEQALNEVRYVYLSLYGFIFCMDSGLIKPPSYDSEKRTPGRGTRKLR